MHRGHRPGPYRNPHVALLFAQLAARVLQLEYKPPATLVLVAVNVLLFVGDLRQLLPPRALSRLLDGALQPRLVVQGGQWWRLVSSAFLHLDEWHIYYNMSSLVWKGVQLERRYGSVLFAALVSELLLLSHGLYVLITVLLSSQIPDYGYLYRDLQVAGFSAVLFALKVVLTHHSPDYSDIMGFTIPTKYACWAELLLASYLTPHASFLGHLAGILAGLLHVRALEPAARGAWGQLRLWYVRGVNTGRRRAMPRDGGRRLGGGGGSGGDGRTALAAAHPDQRSAARNGLGGAAAAAAAAAGGSVSGSRYGGGGAARGLGGAVRQTGAGSGPRRPDAAAEDSDSDASDYGTAAGGGGMTVEEVRRKRLERLGRTSPTTARGRYGPNTARRTGGEPQRAAGADPFQAAAIRGPYFNCGGTLGGGDGGGGGGSGGGDGGGVPKPSESTRWAGADGAGDARGVRVGFGEGDQPGQQRPAPDAVERPGGGGVGRAAVGTTALSSEELRQRRLDWLDRPRRG